VSNQCFIIIQEALINCGEIRRSSESLLEILGGNDR